MMRSGLRRTLFTCAAGLLSVAVVVAAIALPGGDPTAPNAPGASPLASYALARPVYPDFPTQPVYVDGMYWD